MLISLATTDDLDPLVHHLGRLISQSGKYGAPISTPHPPGRPPEPERLQEQHREGWALSLEQPAWLRTFALREGDLIVGHASLRGGRLPTELHRASLGMGIEWKHRRQGHGRHLLDHAASWAREAGLSWIDLGVFENNAPARALYREAGFVEVGRREDQFRVEGQSITDIQMSLRLR